MTLSSPLKQIRLMAMALGVGLLMGLISTVFLNALTLAGELRTRYPILLLFLPLIGVLTIMTYTHWGKGSQKGNNLIIDSVHSPTTVPFRMAILTFIFTISTHLFGGSAGREGTGVQIGGTLSNTLADHFHLDHSEKRLLVMAGISAGFASVFGTPLSGAIFGLEVAFIGKLSLEALFPCLIAAYSASTVTHVLGITHTTYLIAQVPLFSPWVILIVILASIVFGLTGSAFAQCIHTFKKVIAKQKAPIWLKAFLGGTAVIAVMFALDAQRFAGLSTWLIQAGFDGKVQIWDPFLKFLLTVMTLGAGYQGGEVTPLFGIGASLGGLIGQISGVVPSLLAALGFIAVFGSAANTPLTTIVLGIELFGIQAVPFYVLASILSTLFSGHQGIYRAQIIHRPKPFHKIP